MTHNIGHSVLEGYENRFAPVVVCDYAQIGMNATIYPGIRIGRSAIVTSNSYVISSVPAGKLATGVPARVVRDAAKTLDRNRQLQIVRDMMKEYTEHLRRRGCYVSPLETSPCLQFTVDHSGKQFRLAFVETVPSAGFEMEAADEVIIWTFAASSDGPPTTYTVMDLLAKTVSGPTGIFSDSTREFLRKRGIRLSPGPWRYSQGLI